MSNKYFSNTLEDFNSSKPSLYLNDSFTNISDGLKEKITAFGEVKLKQLLKDRKEIYSSACAYTGSAGIGLLLYHLAKQKPDTSARDAAFLEAQQYVEGDGRRLRDSPSFLCGAAGPLAVATVLAHSLKTPHAPYSQRLEGMIQLAEKASTPDEILYGRAGYLYALLFVNNETGENIISLETIYKVVQCILISGQRLSAEKGLSVECPLLYCWHDSYYLGAAHGTAGILYLLLQSGDAISSTQKTSLVFPTIDWLLRQRYASGNLPSSLGSKSDRLVQWCHGAPGLVQLVCLAHKERGDERYLEAALQCGNVVWERGLCTKGYSICHGVAGNAYTFLQLFQHTKDVIWLHRAGAFADWCLEERPGTELHSPDRPASLAEGLAGRLYFLHDMLQPLHAKFPAYTP